MFVKLIIFYFNSFVKKIIFSISYKSIFILSLFFYNYPIYFSVVLLFIIMYNFHFVKVLDILQSKICTHHNFVNILYLIPIYLIIIFICLTLFLLCIYFILLFILIFRLTVNIFHISIQHIIIIYYLYYFLFIN
jgi:hypothetical protein